MDTVHPTTIGYSKYSIWLAEQLSLPVFLHSITFNSTISETPSNTKPTKYSRITEFTFNNQRFNVPSEKGISNIEMDELIHSDNPIYRLVVKGFTQITF